MTAQGGFLVTGASGYVGSRLVRHLLADGSDVTTLGRRPVAGAKHLAVETYRPAEFNEVLSGRRFDCLVNLAAAGVHPTERDARALHEVNVLLAAELIRTLAGRIRCSITIGSNAEYAPVREPTRLAEDAPLERAKAYGSTKALGGLVALSAGRSFDVLTAHLRVFNVYGPGEPGHRLLPSIISGVRSGNPVCLSEGTQVRDFVHVDDVCEAIIQSASGLASGAMGGGAFNVCTGRATSVRAFALQAARCLDAPESVLRFGAIEMRPDETAWLVGDPERLKTALGWSARLDPVEGILRSIEEDRSRFRHPATERHATNN